jgi:hypothetical protein
MSDERRHDPAAAEAEAYEYEIKRAHAEALAKDEAFTLARNMRAHEAAAETAFREIQANPTRCWGEVMADLPAKDRRSVEIALEAEKTAADEGIPVRDALHRLNVPDAKKVADRHAQTAAELLAANASYDAERSRS